MAFLKKIRLISWVTKGFFSKHGKIIIFSFLIGIGGFFAIFKLAPYLPQPKPHKKIAYIGQFSNREELPQEILKLISAGLTVLREDGSAVPGLAKDWKISDDGKTYTFFINEKARWNDNTDLKAEQLDYQFEEVETEIINDKTIRFKLKEPFSPFPVIVSRPVFKENFIGIGSYKLKQFKKTANTLNKLVLSNPEKNLIYKFYPTQETAYTAFKLGEVDVLEGLLENKFSKQWKEKLEIEKSISKDQYLGLFFNNENDFLGDKKVRQALAYAIKDKPTGDSRATGPISPNSWAYNPDVKLYLYDAEKAKNLLGEDEIGQELIIATTEPFLKKAEQIKKSWQETLGVKTHIEIINSLNDNFQIFLGIQEIPADPDQYVLWHSTRQENITNFQNVKVDKLLEDGRKLVDREKRKQKYFDFQKTITEETPVVFLEHPAVYKISRRKIFPWL